ncbi:tetratricopeptide repeat protein [Paenibacillus thalictri]|uniref:Tetratricopeptide repeat protein n=1 Tax=Paenibacillus thalictri TaxID=2527873 RepID=A0A4Q9DL11_9BACL|nr:tetratricopeptide repeat protein [Paenibacillus thalictri]TBL73937.1 tetratricopeptide repeat protein [Paenibacillus thalictri]
MKAWLKPLLKIVIPIVIVLILFQVGRWYGIAALVILLVYAGLKLRANFFVVQANSRFAKKDLIGAAESFGKAYQLSKNASYAISRAFLLLKNRQVEEAEKLLADILKQPLAHTEKMNAKINYSMALWMLGQKQQSLEWMEEVFSEFKNTIVYGNLGLFYVMNGDLDKALSFNLEAYEYNDSDKTILDNLGYTYHLLGRHQEAKETYEKLLALKPTFAEAFYYYGLTLGELGERDRAVEVLEQGLEFEPSMMTDVKRDTIESKLKEWRTEEM